MKQHHCGRVWAWAALLAMAPSPGCGGGLRVPAGATRGAAGAAEAIARLRGGGGGPVVAALLGPAAAAPSPEDELFRVLHAPLAPGHAPHAAGGVTVVEVVHQQGVESNAAEDSAPAWKAGAVLVMAREAMDVQVATALPALSGLSAWSPRLPHLLVVNAATNVSTSANAEATAARAVHQMVEAGVWRAAALVVSDAADGACWAMGAGAVGCARGGLPRRPFPRALPRPPLRQLRATAVPWPPYTILDERASPPAFRDGLEIRALRSLSEALGCELRVLLLAKHTLPFAALLRNGSAALAAGAYYPTAERFATLGAAVPHWAEPLRWFVPRARPVPRWLGPARVFETPVWRLLAAAALASAATWELAARMRLRRPPSTQGAKRALLRWRHALEVAVRGSTALRPAAPSQQALLLPWVLGCFVLCSAYQSGLICFLADPGTLPGIKDLDGLLASRLLFGFQHFWTDFFREAEDPAYKVIVERAVPCDDMLPCLDRAAFRGDAAVATDQSYVDYLLPSRYTRDGRPLLEPIPYSVSTQFPVLYLARHSPLLEWTDFVVSGLTCGGLFEKWLRQLSGGRHVVTGREPQEPVVLTVVHMQGAFLLLVVGLGVGGAAFAAEALVTRGKRRWGSTQELRSTKLYSVSQDK